MAEIYTLYFGTESGNLSLVAAQIDGVTYAVPDPPLEYNTVYYWRVDATNEYGTTTGDEWSFTTLVFDPPTTSWENLPGKTLGPLTGGVEGVDFRWLGTNGMITRRRLVAAAANAIWYEDV